MFAASENFAATSSASHCNAGPRDATWLGSIRVCRLFYALGFLPMLGGPLHTLSKQ